MTARRLACAVVELVAAALAIVAALFAALAVAGATEFSLLSTIMTTPPNAPWVCTRPSGNKVRCTSVRLIGPSPTPEPTRSPTPSPTVLANCSDGMLSKLSPRVMGIVHKAFEPGRSYRFCADLPAPGNVVTLSSRNYANASCDDLQTWLVAPSGTTAMSGGSQPGSGARFEAGRWQLVVRLKPDDPSACVPHKGFDLYLSWF